MRRNNNESKINNIYVLLEGDSRIQNGRIINESFGGYKTNKKNRIDKKNLKYSWSLTDNEIEKCSYG